MKIVLCDNCLDRMSYAPRYSDGFIETPQMCDPCNDLLVAANFAGLHERYRSARMHAFSQTVIPEPTP